MWFPRRDVKLYQTNHSFIKHKFRTRRQPAPNNSTMKTITKFVLLVICCSVTVYYITSAYLMSGTNVIKTDFTAESWKFQSDNFIYKELNRMEIKSVHNNGYRWPVKYFFPKSIQETEIHTLKFLKNSPENYTLRKMENPWNYQTVNNKNVKNLEQSLEFKNSNATNTKSNSGDTVDEDGVYSLGLKLVNGTFVLNGDILRIVSVSADYSQFSRDEWRYFQLQGFNTVNICIDREFTKDRIESLRKFLTMVQETYLFVILEIKLYRKCSGNHSTVDHVEELKSNQTLDAYLKNIVPVVEEFQVTRGGPIIAFQLSGLFDYSTDQQYLTLKVLRFHGIQELILIAESPNHLYTYPFPHTALPVIILDDTTLINKLSHEVQMLNNDFPLMIVVKQSNASDQNLLQTLPKNISFIVSTND